MFKLSCYSGAVCGMDLEGGDKIVLPASVLDRLSKRDIVSPMCFEIIAENGRTHTSVLEFTAPEGECYMPYWLMMNLFIQEGQIVKIRMVTLPKAEFVKFRPQDVRFLDIPEVRDVLEQKLRFFSCVTEGDHLMFEFCGNHYLEVVEVIPEGAACIIDTDVKVDFEAPVGYVEPAVGYVEPAVEPVKKSLPSPQSASTQSVSKLTVGKTKWSSQKIYTPFGGSGHKLS